MLRQVAWETTVSLTPTSPHPPTSHRPLIEFAQCRTCVHIDCSNGIQMSDTENGIMKLQTIHLRLTTRSQQLNWIIPTFSLIPYCYSQTCSKLQTEVYYLPQDLPMLKVLGHEHIQQHLGGLYLGVGICPDLYLYLLMDTHTHKCTWLPAAYSIAMHLCRHDNPRTTVGLVWLKRQLFLWDGKVDWAWQGLPGFPVQWVDWFLMTFLGC